MHHDSNAAAFVAAVSQVLLALFGVDYYAMLWAFVGALLALSQVPKMARSRALVYVLLSTLAGAAIGAAGADFLNGKTRAYLIILSLVAGSGAQLLISALLHGALNRIKTTLGGVNEPTQSSH